MSGGFFDYKQDNLHYLIDDINNLLKNIDNEDYYCDKEKIKQIYTEAKKYSELAYIYNNRIDYFESGDDSEESFFERLDEDLGKIK